VTFTKKHYNIFAEILKKFGASEKMIMEFADLFEIDNPNFKREMFIKACK